MLGMIDLEPRDVDLEGVWNGIGRAPNVYRVGHDIDSSTALDAGGLVGINDTNRNAHSDGGPFAQPHEIHVDRQVADRINLEIARYDPVLGPIDLDVVKACQELAGIDSLAQLRMVERDVDRGLIIPVDHAGHAARAARGPGGPLAGPRTCRRLDFLDGRHFTVPRVRARIRAGGCRRPFGLQPIGLLIPAHLPTCRREAGLGPAVDLQGCYGAAVARLIAGAS